LKACVYLHSSPNLLIWCLRTKKIKTKPKAYGLCRHENPRIFCTVLFIAKRYAQAQKMRSKREKYKSWIIFGSGFLTLLLMSLFPVDGGGVSLIFVLSVPILIALSIILALIYKWRAKKTETRWKRNVLFTSSTLLVLFLTFYFFPCSESDSPCPCKIVAESVKVANNFEDITYNDLFLKKKKSNYPLIIAAQKKFKSQIPNDIYYISYFPSETYLAEKEYAIYNSNGLLKSNNSNLSIQPIKNNLIQYTEIFKGDTISFKGTTEGFVKMENEFQNYNDNGYGYIDWNKSFPKHELSIRKEVENDITENYYFYKLFYWLL